MTEVKERGVRPTDESPDIIGENERMRSAIRAAGQVASSTTTVLIRGESGTGKELLARYIHERSGRTGPFVAVNCAAVPEHLLESEFFGHERGAFTGASSRRIGLFERASGGTLLLDEIGEMSLPLQAKLLRVLESGEIERVGGAAPIAVDARVVAATHCDLERCVRENRFRADLYYRLAIVVLTLPTLRERGRDIRLLADHFCAHFAREHGRPLMRLSPDAVALLERRSWPGNVRELRNAIERAVLLSRSQVLRPEVFADHGMAHAPPSSSEPGIADADGAEFLTLDELVWRHILRALRVTAGNRTHAAELLGIHRNTLRRKLDALRRKVRAADGSPGASGG